jgi:succinate dehydrogenase/fumarate reductase cytochrome b subunit
MSDIIQGQKPSEEELFYKQWGWETLKNNISTVNGVLKQYITINTVLLSAYLGFFEKIAINYWVKIVLFILLILSFIISIIGIFPFPINVSLNKPYDIKTYKEKRAKCKNLCLVLATCSLIIAFVIFLVAILTDC